MKRANGEGSLYYDKNRNYWRATITLPSGKIKDFCSKSKNKAIQKRNEYMRNNYQKLEFSETTIVECCQKYLEIFYNQKRFSENTYRTHLDTIKRITKSNLADLSVGAITTADINTYIVNAIKNNYSKSIIKKDKAMINWGIKYAREMGLIQNNPLDSIFLDNYWINAKNTKKIQALTPEEQSRFFVTLQQTRLQEQPYSDIWLLAILTGLRVGEICALEYTDINFKNQTISVNKTITRDVLGRYIVGIATKTQNGHRIIQYSDVVANLLEDIKKYKQNNSNFLFSDGFGNFILPARIAYKLREFNKKYKIANKLTMHIFRHTFATRMIEQDIPAYAVQHLLGHARVDITLDTYTDFFENQRRKYTDQINQYWSKQL